MDCGVVIGVIRDLAAGPPVVGAVVAVRAGVPGAVAGGRGLERGRAVPTRRSPDSAASIPREPPWRLWRSLYGWQPAFPGRSWAFPRRLSALAVNHKTAAAP